MIWKLDASASAKSDCEEKFRLLELGYTNQIGKEFKQEFGTAFHKAIAHYYRTGDQDEAITVAQAHYIEIEVPEKDHRQIGYLTKAIKTYFDTYSCDLFDPIRKGKDVCVERSFALPFYKEGDSEVLLCGTIDAIGEYGSLPFCIKDIKTTALVQNPRAYLESYVLNSQMLTYAVAVKRMFPGLHIEGVPFIIDGLFLYPSGAVPIRSTPFTYPLEHINRQEEILLKNAKLLCSFSENKEAKRNFNCCSEHYGSCAYLNICKLKNPELRAEILKRLPRKEYDPLKFQQ